MPNAALFPSREYHIPVFMDVIDSLLTAEHNLQVSTGGQPVESGRMAIDHAVAEPDRIRLTGQLSDFYGPNRIFEGWDKMRRVMRDLEPVRLVTPVHTYEEMLIVGLNGPHTGLGIRFEIMLEEILIVDVEELPPVVLGRGSGSDDDGGGLSREVQRIVDRESEARMAKKNFGADSHFVLPSDYHTRELQAFAHHSQQGYDPDFPSPKNQELVAAYRETTRVNAGETYYNDVGFFTEASQPGHPNSDSDSDIYKLDRLVASLTASADEVLPGIFSVDTLFRPFTGETVLSGDELIYEEAVSRFQRDRYIVTMADARSYQRTDPVDPNIIPSDYGPNPIPRYLDLSPGITALGG